MPLAPNFCIQCAKHAETRCAACKIVFYCSQECQRRDWKYHKRQCKQGLSVAGSRMVIAAHGPRIFSATVDQVQLLNVGFGDKRSVYEQATAAGLDHQLIAGASGADSYESNDGRGHFWRLSAPVRDRWEAKARAHNLKTFDFWRGYAEPVSRDAQWVDLALDVITKRKLPIDKESLWQEQVILGFFPHLSQFTPAQNTTLLDLFDLCGDDTFRLTTGARVLFAFGQPTTDLIDKLVARCLSLTRSYCVLENLLEAAVFPIQKHFPEIAGTRILDLWLALLSSGRLSQFPAFEVIPIAETSPVACGYLLPAIVDMCRARTIPKSALTLIELLEFFGATIHGDLSAWLVTEFAGDDAKVSRVETLMEETEGGGGRFGIEARIYSSVELEDLNKAAEQRLGIRILRAID